MGDGKMAEDAVQVCIDEIANRSNSTKDHYLRHLKSFRNFVKMSPNEVHPYVNYLDWDSGVRK